MKIHIARHHGMCFGVRDALRKTHETASRGPVTVLGQLVHNPVVSAHLRTLGVQEGRLDDTGSAPTPTVVITAHGAADHQREAWKNRGSEVIDTTCPLVRKAHSALAALVTAGYAPVVIGKKGHVEVRGLTGDFPDAVVIEDESDLEDLPPARKIGVVSQTTQPFLRVNYFVTQIKTRRPFSEVKWVDTVCQPTKDRQSALEDLCAVAEVVIVVGGRNSNNTRELVQTSRDLGCVAHHVEGPDDLDPEWLDGHEHVGVTAGTSTLDETVQAVVERLKLLATEARQPRHGLLRLFA